VKTREIRIGNLILGGNNPVVVQSMTNTNTMDTMATVQQVMDLVEAGCEMVRITARNKYEAENLKKIKAALAERNCHIPLIADIHFMPDAAEIAARIVEKVRINPGNYVDKKTNERGPVVYSESLYRQELDNISLRLKPLLDICKEYGTAIRIGVNHGSLSDRVTGRYGDTVEGMVASALEFIDICRYHDFKNLVLSMKSSDVKTMIYAYRLLTSRMNESGYDYPLHLGVTEAGAGMDARIKSAAGIGELLMEGIGDTIRVSLTENPAHEIPVAKRLVEAFATPKRVQDYSGNFKYTKRETINIGGIGKGHHPVCVFPDMISNKTKSVLPDYYFDIKNQSLKSLYGKEDIVCVQLKVHDSDDMAAIKIAAGGYPGLLLVDFSETNNLQDLRSMLFNLKNHDINNPLVLYKKYSCSNENLILQSSAEFAYFLTDGLIDGICIDTHHDKSLLPELMFSILQALGLRRVKAEFIACPTCGRTSYDVEGTLKKLTQALSHLKHLKIGVMGCVVNGPGEMADADYGYVGSSPGKINLYRKKQVVLRNIDECDALNELIRLIREDGCWEDEE